MRSINYLITCLTLFVSLGLHATTYFVSINGNDNDSGTENQPWKTIQKAADELEAGDTVIILEGVYEEQVIPKKSGQAGKYIIYKAKSGAEVIIDGANLNIADGHSALFLIHNKNYIKVIGISVRNIGTTYSASYDQAGFMIENAHHIEIKNCTTYNTFSSGIISLNSHDLSIDNNLIRKACNGGEQECISITDGSYNFEVMNNEVYDGGSGLNGGEGIDVKQGSHDGDVHHNYVHNLPKRLGIYVDAYEKHTYNINVYQNKVHDCADGGFALSSEAGGFLENISIYNNIAYHNEYYGLIISNWDEAITNTHPMKKIRIINNTFYNNKWAGQNWGAGIIMENLHAEDIIINNNICSENIEQIMIVDNVNLSELTTNNNLVFGNQLSGLGFNNNIVEDPDFINKASADFHLKSTSAAIDGGTSSHAPTIDFDGNSRPVNGTPDIGAFEYGSTLSLDNYNISLNKAVVYPNPFKDEAIIKINNNKNVVYTLKLYNALGRKVKTISNISGAHIRINRENLKKGVYFFQILYDGKTHSEGKLMIN